LHNLLVHKTKDINLIGVPGASSSWENNTIANVSSGQIGLLTRVHIVPCLLSQIGKREVVLWSVGICKESWESRAEMDREVVSRLHSLSLHRSEC
jgi:hypothetical protein